MFAAVGVLEVVDGIVQGLRGGGIGGLLALAKDHGMTVETLDLRNSADTAGLMAQVVGYGSWIFME